MSEMLIVEDLCKEFAVPGSKKTVKAVDHVSFTLERGQTLGVVGESGCGKTTLGRLIMQLIAPTSGSVSINGITYTGMREREIRPHRGDFQMVFQDSYAALDPRMNIRRVLEEPLRAHGIARSEWQTRMEQILNDVGLPVSALDRYPHEFSGGQRQRICIARALLLTPKLLVADEPVAALDVSVQAQILNLLRDLQEKYELSVIFISHNLSTVQYVSDRIAVMYLGHLVELAPADAVYKAPAHPYTQSLISAIPLPDPTRKRSRIHLEGEIPNPIDCPPGCPFAPRCPQACEACSAQMPVLRETEPGHLVACHRVS